MPLEEVLLKNGTQAHYVSRPCISYLGALQAFSALGERCLSPRLSGMIEDCISLPTIMTAVAWVLAEQVSLTASERHGDC